MIKKTFLLLGIGIFLASTFFQSCQKEQIVTNGQTIGVALENLQSEENDKTIYDITNPTTGVGVFKWTTSDKVRIYDADNGFTHQVFVDPGASAQYDYVHNTVSGQTTFTTLAASTDPSDATGYSVNLTNTGHYYAFYPSFYVERSNNEFLVTIPHQSIIDNNKNINKIKEMQLTRFPKASKTTGYNFYLQNLCAGLKLNLTKQGTKVKRIEVIAIGDQHLTGTFDVTFATDDGTPILNQRTSSINSTNKSVVLELNQAIPIDDGQDFFIALPGITYDKGLKIVITNDNNETATVTLGTKSGTTFTRSLIKRVTAPSTKLNFTRSHGVFSINDEGDQVYIAPGNLQYYNANWQFANEQYEIIHRGTCDVNNPGTYTPGYEWDLFHYSVYNNGRYWQDGDKIRTPDDGSLFGRATVRTPYKVQHEDNNDNGDAEGSTRLKPQFLDWGKAFGPTSKWKTPSFSELDHIMLKRKTTTANQLHCRVNGDQGTLASYQRVVLQGTDNKLHPGIILFPDNWANDYTDTKVYNEINAITERGYYWTVNSWNASGWEDEGHIMPISVFRVLEGAGCAFLPATGKIDNSLTTGATAIMEDLCLTGSWNSALLYYWTRDNYDHGHGVVQADAWTCQNYGPSVKIWNKETYQPFFAVRLVMPVPTSSTNN